MEHEGSLLLQNAPLRYMQLRRQVGGSTQKMLTQTLRKLEKEGLVTRTVYPTSPPTVEYALTSLGEMLQAPLSELVQWARVYTAQFQPIRENDSEGDLRAVMDERTVGESLHRNRNS